ncbi:hypothetical protein IB271_23490 [Ensifer sp. ENS01]|nr:hypothetical protein [Ensifer sp. ENS01]
MVGWKKKVEAFKDPKTGEARERLLWLVPSNNDEGIIPRYTLNIHDAYSLAQELSPDNVGGCSWIPGKGTAIINDGPYCEAASPPIALCIAALKAIQERPS